MTTQDPLISQQCFSDLLDDPASWRRNARIAAAIVPAHDVEDVLQNARIRAWRAARSRPRDPVAAQAWLATIVRREALRWRSRQRPTTELSPSLRSSEDLERDAGSREALRGSLSLLDPLDRALVWWRLVEARPYAAIAADTGMTAAAARVRVHRARRRLRADLGRDRADTPGASRGAP